MKIKKSIIIILLFLIIIIPPVNSNNIAIQNGTNNTPISAPVQANISHGNNLTNPAGNGTSSMISSSDKQFLFLMNQYWIPDFYDIKGRIDSSATFGSDLPQMLNLSADYARIRLKRNINETNGYALSPAITGLRTQYQTGALQSITVIDKIMALNRSDGKFGEEVPSYSAALSLYGTWLEYQAMRCYNLPNMTYPEIAAVPPDKFMQVMGAITP